jgi:hypothetical protein
LRYRNEKIFEIESGSTRSHSLKNSLAKRLWPCRKADCMMMMMTTTTTMCVLCVRPDHPPVHQVPREALGIDRLEIEADCFCLLLCSVDVDNVWTLFYPICMLPIIALGFFFFFVFMADVLISVMKLNTFSKRPFVLTLMCRE